MIDDELHAADASDGEPLQDNPLQADERQAALAYHAPAAAPRDLMWAAISARRAADRAERRDGIDVSTATEYPAPARIPSEMRVKYTTRRAMPERWRWIALATGVAVICSGVALNWRGRSAPDRAFAARSTSAEIVRIPDPSAPVAVAWQVAGSELFRDAETMLTTVATSSDAQSDPQLAAWSRDLLASTRLLLDSPAATDPRQQALMQDLELVLVQLVESGPASGIDDGAAIDDLLTRSALLLTRIRTTSSAGAPAMTL